MQKRYFNFLDDDATYDIAGMNIPVTNTGRLCGFDTLEGNIYDFSINHSTTGTVRVNKLQTEDILGAWVTLTGVIITETEAIQGLRIEKNLTDYDRIDIITGSHEYLFSAGGMEAFYGIVQGQPAEQPTPPAVSDTIREVILGYFIVPKNTSSLSQIVYCPANSNYLKNDKLDTRYNTPGEFTHHIRTDSVSVLMGTVEAAKTTLTLHPIEVKDKLIHGYPNYYPNYFYLTGLEPTNSIDTFIKIVAPDIPENQVIHLINPYAKIAISESLATTTDNIYSVNPQTHYYYPGEVIVLQRKNNVWNLLNGEFGSRARKFNDKVSFSLANYTLTENRLVPVSTKRGNVLSVQVLGQEPQLLKYLPSQSIHLNTDGAGALLFVEFLGNSSYNLEIFHNGQEPPEGYKPIRFATNEANFTAHDGRMMLGFVECIDCFKPINWGLDVPTNSPDYIDFLGKNETKYIYENTGYRAEAGLCRLKGRVFIRHSQVAAPDIGKIATLFPTMKPVTEKQFNTQAYPAEYDFGLSPENNAHKPIPIIITFQGENTPQPGIFISGGGYITENYVIYLDGITFDLK